MKKSLKRWLLVRTYCLNHSLLRLGGNLSDAQPCAVIFHDIPLAWGRHILVWHLQPANQYSCEEIKTLRPLKAPLLSNIIECWWNSACSFNNMLELSLFYCFVDVHRPVAVGLLFCAQGALPKTVSFRVVSQTAGWLALSPDSQVLYHKVSTWNIGICVSLLMSNICCRTFGSRRSYITGQLPMKWRVIL